MTKSTGKLWPRMLGKPIELRLFSRVITTENGCWEWQAGKNGAGYGSIVHNGRHWLAHRLSYILKRGEIPCGAEILHKCDNPSCINPDHLFAGTQSDNINDAWNKGRIQCGEDCRNSKLTANQVIEIRKLGVSKNYSKQQIANQFSVSRTHIRNILQGKRWRHILPTSGDRK